MSRASHVPSVVPPPDTTPVLLENDPSGDDGHRNFLQSRWQNLHSSRAQARSARLHFAVVVSSLPVARGSSLGAPLCCAPIATRRARSRSASRVVSVCAAQAL